MREVPLVNEEYYHIFNRGVDKRKVFLDDSDYWRFLFSLRLMNDKNNGAMIAWTGLLMLQAKNTILVEESAIRPYERTDDVEVNWR